MIRLTTILSLTLLLLVASKGTAETEIDLTPQDNCRIMCSLGGNGVFSTIKEEYPITERRSYLIRLIKDY